MFRNAQVKKEQRTANAAAATAAAGGAVVAATASTLGFFASGASSLSGAFAFLGIVVDGSVQFADA